MAKEFRRDIRKLINEKFPLREKYLLADQILRATDSICLNIAEGSNRRTDKDFAHFLNSALTSLEEVVCGLDLALDDLYITIQDCNKMEAKAENLGRQLIGFQKNLLRTKNLEPRTQNRKLITKNSSKFIVLGSKLKMAPIA